MNAVTPRPAFREATSELRAKAAALHGAGRVEEALLVLQEIVRREPDDFGGQYNLGFVLQHLGRFDPAIEAYRAAIQDLALFSRRWPGALARLISSRMTIDEAPEAFRKPAAGLKQVVAVAD